MQRLHLFELEDFGWLPAPIRDGGTDFLDFLFDRLGFYDGVAPKLVDLLRRTGADRVIDLASGGGGGTLQLRRKVRAAGLATEFVFSDGFPNEAGRARVSALADPAARYLAEPLDAMGGGGGDSGVRTMSGALHHFTPDAVSQILAGIVQRRAPLAFFDVASSPALRKLPLPLAPIAMSVNMLMLFGATLAVVPFLRPFRPSRLLLTYLLPLIPALVAWDGTVSALRAYSPDELLTIARAVPGADSYRWHAGVAGSALYLTGEPL
jgi:hypothetical protein